MFSSEWGCAYLWGVDELILHKKFKITSLSDVMLNLGIEVERDQTKTAEVYCSICRSRTPRSPVQNYPVYYKKERLVWSAAMIHLVWSGFPKVPHHDSILMAVTLLFPWQPCECMVHDSPQNKTHATYNITVGNCSHRLLSLCVRSPMTTSALAQTVSRWLDTKWRKSLRSARAFYFCWTCRVSWYTPRSKLSTRFMYSSVSVLSLVVLITTRPNSRFSIRFYHDFRFVFITLVLKHTEINIKPIQHGPVDQNC